MKKVITMMLAVALGTAAFANNGPDNELAKSNFNQIFAAATEVSWTAVEESDLLKVRFMYKGEQAEAYFNPSGEMVASGRYIGNKQLPMAISRQIEQRYADYSVSPKVVEYETNGETSYLVTLLGEKQDLVLKATVNGPLSIYKKSKKA